MKNIIITGACGLVGMNLLTKLDLDKYQITIIDQNKHNLELAKKIFPQIKIIYADVSKTGDWENEFKNIDAIIQLQAQISSPNKSPYVKNNICSVEKIVKLCETNKIPNLIHLSSSVVISVADDHYTNTKRIGEEMIAKSNVTHTIIRPPLMYGCFDIKHLGFLTRLLELSPIFPIPGNGKFMRQPLFVEDLCDVIIKLIEKKPKNKIYDLIGKERINFIDLIKMIAKEKKLKRIYLPISIPFFVGLLKTYNFITRHKPFVPEQLYALIAGDDFPITNWNKELGVKYTPFKEGIRKTYASPYYKYRKQMVKMK